jgi:hypothetical protein
MLEISSKSHLTQSRIQTVTNRKQRALRRTFFVDISLINAIFRTCFHFYRMENCYDDISSEENFESALVEVPIILRTLFICVHTVYLT